MLFCSVVEVPYLHLQRVSMRAPPRTTNNGLGFRAKTRFQKTKKTSPDLFNQAMVHLLRATKTDALEPGHGALHPMRHNDRNYPPHISQKKSAFCDCQVLLLVWTSVMIQIVLMGVALPGPFASLFPFTPARVGIARLAAAYLVVDKIIIVMTGKSHG